jgi:signal transduction histidine kinase
MRSRLLAWAGIWLGCTALGLFFGTTLWLNYVAQGREARLVASLQVSLAEWWIWALLAPVPVWLAGRYPLAPPHRVRDGLLHVLAGGVVAFAKAMLERGARVALFGVAPYMLPSTLALHFLIYWAIVVMTLAAAYYQRARARELQASRLEAHLTEARLDALRSQLQPHFLFNTLNTIAELVHEDAERADRMLAGLSDLLRASLDAGGRPRVALHDEVRLTERYLSIQQERFGDRLSVGFDVAEDCRDLLVPQLLLQPLVENAVVHGIAPTERGGRILVTVSRRERSLELVVEDDGAGPDGAAVRDGLGLSNTRARLETLYGDRASLVVQGRPAGGTRAVVHLPLEQPS